MLKKTLLFLPAVNCCFAQLPDTDLWLFSIKKNKDLYTVEKGVNITNRPGYDNQPSFSADDRTIYYVSIREDKQADIYAYQIAQGRSIQLTKTPESEYSPAETGDSKSLNCVVVEKDSAQRIWTYDVKTGAAENLLFDEDSVGYYTFLNADTVLYYKLTRPHSLRARSLSTGKDVFIAESPVRGFKPVRRHEFIFGIKDSLQVSYYRYNTLLQKAVKYSVFASQNEDLVWHPWWGLLKSETTQILRYDEKEQKWLLLFDFGASGIKKITRFAFDNRNKKIVITDNK
jgi:hypothetical protein